MITAQRTEHLNGIVHDLCISVLPHILGAEHVEPDGFLLDDYGMDVLGGYEIEIECERRWYVSLNLNLGFSPNVIITPLDLAKAIQTAQDKHCAAYDAHRAA
jgi:hypothetical protein